MCRWIFSYIQLGNGLANMTPRAQVTKEWNGYIGLHQHLNIHPSKCAIARVSKQPTEWEELFVNYISVKRLYPGLYKDYIKNSSTQKWKR